MAVTILVFVALLKLAVSMPDPNVNVDVKLNINEGTDDIICSLQRDPGTCKAIKPRFFYSVHFKGCFPFEWGGCDGNANRFLTYEDCAKKCVSKSDQSVGGSINNSTSLEFAFATGPCNDNYASWSIQTAPLGQAEAASFCNTQQGQKLACPISGHKFQTWLQGRPSAQLTDYHWFYGNQGSKSYFNYYQWNSGAFIPRVLSSGVNLWENDQPAYGTPDLCVKGKLSLTTENCDTKLLFYCSP